MTAAVPVKGVKRYRDRHGKWRCYHRKSRKAIKAEFGTAEFFAEVKALDEATKDKRPQAGTLGALIIEYRSAPAWRDLAPATRQSYERCFTIVRSFHALALVDLDPPFVATIRDKVATKHGRRSANLVLAVLSLLCTFGKERGLVRDNPIRGLKRVKAERGKVKANRPWSLEERRAVLDAAPRQLKVPLALAMFTGVRKADALTLTKAALKGGFINTAKTGEEVFVQVHPDLQAILSGAPRHGTTTIASTSNGTVWTVSGFNSVWGRFRDELEAGGSVGPGLTIHGLRHTVGGLLADLGTDLDTIRRVLGQKTLHMAQHYSERAKKEEATRGAVHRLDPLGRRPKGLKAEHEVSNPGEKSV